MQLQRNASQVSEGDSELTADEKAVLAQELADPATSLSELRFRTALGPSQAFDQQLGLSEGCDASGEGISEADDGSGPGRHQSDDTDSSSDGLYAAAAKVPTEMKAAWRESLELQQQQKGKQSTDHKPKGRHGDGLLPIKILKCLQGKTLSDVEAQMHALGVDKHLR